MLAILPTPKSSFVSWYLWSRSGLPILATLISSTRGSSFPWRHRSAGETCALGGKSLCGTAWHPQSTAAAASRMAQMRVFFFLPIDTDYKRQPTAEQAEAVCPLTLFLASPVTAARHWLSAQNKPPPPMISALPGN